MSSFSYNFQRNRLVIDFPMVLGEAVAATSAAYVRCRPDRIRPSWVAASLPCCCCYTFDTTCLHLSHLHKITSAPRAYPLDRSWESETPHLTHASRDNGAATSQSEVMSLWCAAHASWVCSARGVRWRRPLRYRTSSSSLLAIISHCCHFSGGWGDASRLDTWVPDSAQLLSVMLSCINITRIHERHTRILRHLRMAFERNFRYI